MADRGRFDEFIQELSRVRNDISDQEMVERFEAKIVDMIEKEQLTTDDIEVLRREVRFEFRNNIQLVQQLEASYDEMNSFISEMYEDVGPPANREWARLKTVESINASQLGNFESDIVSQIIRAIDGEDLQRLDVDAVRRKIRRIGSKAGDFATTLANTHVKRYARTVKRQKALRGGIDFYEYLGVLRDTTRNWCRAHIFKTFHISVILQLENGMLEPPIENSGGWNCIHDFEPDPAATAEDAVQGQFFTLPISSGRTAIIYGESSAKKIFQFSTGLENVGNRPGGIRKYISDQQKRDLSDAAEKDLTRRRPELEDRDIRNLLDDLRSNPDRIAYQYDDGPRVVFEKDGRFAFVSGRKVEDVVIPDDVGQFRQDEAEFYVDLNDHLDVLD